MPRFCAALKSSFEHKEERLQVLSIQVRRYNRKCHNYTFPSTRLVRQHGEACNRDTRAYTAPPCPPHPPRRALVGRQSAVTGHVTRRQPTTTAEVSRRSGTDDTPVSQSTGEREAERGRRRERATGDNTEIEIERERNTMLTSHYPLNYPAVLGLHNIDGTWRAA